MSEGYYDEYVEKRDRLLDDLIYYEDELMYYYDGVYQINEKKLLEKLAKAKKKLEDYKKQIFKKAKANRVKPRSVRKMTRKDMINILANETGQPKSHYKRWTLDNLDERLEALFGDYKDIVKTRGFQKVDIKSPKRSAKRKASKSKSRRRSPAKRSAKRSAKRKASKSKSRRRSPAKRSAKRKASKSKSRRRSPAKRSAKRKAPKSKSRRRSPARRSASKSSSSKRVLKPCPPHQMRNSNNRCVNRCKGRNEVWSKSKQKCAKCPSSKPIRDRVTKKCRASKVGKRS